MSEDIAPYGNSEPEITRLRMQLHHAEIQRDAFTLSLRKEVLKVAREAIAQAAKESEGTHAFLKAEVARLTGELTGLKSEADRLKAENERLWQKVQHLETTWPRDPNHGGKIYQLPVEIAPTFVNVDELLAKVKTEPIPLVVGVPTLQAQVNRHNLGLDKEGGQS